MNYELAIIGGGPAGYVAAERAGENGLSTILFEEKELGGVCLNEGCIPTKTMLYSAKVYDSAKTSDKYGIINTQTSIDYNKIMQRKDMVVKKLVSGVAAKMKHHKVHVINAKAKILKRDEKGIHIFSQEQNYTAKNLLICTGSEAFVPPIPGIDLTSNIFMTNREILDTKSLPDTLAIIGGGAIGMEFASFYNSMGVKVMVIEMLDKILGAMDQELSVMLQGIYSKRGVEFYLSSKVTHANGGTISFENDKGQHSLTADKVLLSVGRKPVIQGLGLENIGVEIINGGIKVDDKMRTNIPNVFAAGDVKGFAQLAHTASREGEVVVNNLLGKNDRMRYHANPWVAYTNPEIAGVGHTEKSAEKAGIQYKVATLPMAYSGRFIAENHGGSGMCKVLVGTKHQEIIGVHMLGNPSSEMIYGAAMAIENEMTLEEMQEIIFPHPTVSEIFKETIFSF